MPDGSVTSPSFTFQDDQDTGWFRSGSGAVGYSANGVQTLTFDGNGLTVTGKIEMGNYNDDAANTTAVIDESGISDLILSIIFLYFLIVYPLDICFKISSLPLWKGIWKCSQTLSSS